MVIDSRELFKHGNSRLRKWRKMLLFHFYTCSWNAPFTLNKIEFDPFIFSKLTGANKRRDSGHVCSKAQRARSQQARDEHEVYIRSPRTEP